MAQAELFPDQRRTQIEEQVFSEDASLNDWAACIEHWAKEKGWWQDGRTFGDAIALCHTELSEAIEAFRVHGTADATDHPDSWDYGPAKPEGVASELADVLIRVLHLMAEEGMDPGFEMRRKMIYNYTRAFRHGNKAL